MEIVLPFHTHEREHFRECAIDIGFDEFVVLKFICTMQDSDPDVFPLMGTERLSLLIYGWEICNEYWENVSKLTVTDKLSVVVKRLSHCSLHMWFSREWDKATLQLQTALLFAVKRARSIFEKIPELMQINWEYLLTLNRFPWLYPYFNKYFQCIAVKQITENSEIIEQPALEEDITYLHKEGMIIILLRLIKMFDAGSIEAVKSMAIRVIAAWNIEYENKQDKAALQVMLEQDKPYMTLICHIYLMTVYETDNVRGFVIDNMMSNIRFYHRSLQLASTTTSMDEQKHIEYTAARYIAMTCLKLRISTTEFLEDYIFDSFDESSTTIFGITAQAYLSYLLGNLLMELNKMNEQNFEENLDYFKRLFNLYVIERERSEMFLMEELQKKHLQNNCHNDPKTIKNLMDFKSNICKGNRPSNITNYGSSNDDTDDEKEAKSNLDKEENNIRTDPVFQNLPNNENILTYIYKMLAMRTYRGWRFAKLILLLKIIGHELNAIETWRYQPGLTTEFMLGLETKLSHYFEDLAKIFDDHGFMAQEFWLTAFYLNPNPRYYDAILRIGMKTNRRWPPSKFANGDDEKQTAAEKLESSTKYGLLSSTIDVQEIVGMANHEAPNADYEPLYRALSAIRLPESIIKDLLTVIFQPRNKAFAWAVNWPELRKRCKILLKSAEQKRRLVELNMADANDHLKFLEIDYEKYKHRPQLDYGTIESGYENVMSFDETADDSDDSDAYEEPKQEQQELGRGKRRCKFRRHTIDVDEEEEGEDFEGDEEDELFDTYFAGTRRTRARAAAVVATAMFRDFRRTRKQDTTKSSSSTEGTECPKSTTAETETAAVPVLKRNLNELLNECSTYENATNGFRPFSDIWNTTKDQEVTLVESLENEVKVTLLESQNILQKFIKLRQKQKQDQIEALKIKVESQERAEIHMKADNVVEDNEMVCKEVEDVVENNGKVCDEVEGAVLQVCNVMDDGVLQVCDEAESSEQVCKEAENDVVEEFNECTAIVVESERTTAEEEASEICTETEVLLATSFVNVPAQSDDPNNSDDAPTTAVEFIKQLQETQELKQATEVSAIPPPDDNIDEIGKNQTHVNCADCVENHIGEDDNAECIQNHDSEDGKSDAIINRNGEDDKGDRLENDDGEDDAGDCKKYDDCVERDDGDACIQSNEETTIENDDISKEMDERDQLIRECTEKEAKVILRRLTVTDLSQLRQPKVCLKRINMEEYLKMSRAKRHSKHKVYVDSDESNKTNNSTSSYSDGSIRPLKSSSMSIRYAQRRVQQMMKRNYDSSSTESEECNKTKRKRIKVAPRDNIAPIQAVVNKPNSTQSKLIVTPRSASGLKMRISSAPAMTFIATTSTTNITTSVPTTSTAEHHRLMPTSIVRSSNTVLYSNANAIAKVRRLNLIRPVVEYIQLSSSESEELYDSDEPHCNVASFVQTISDPIDPLYEEEIFFD